MTDVTAQAFREAAAIAAKGRSLLARRYEDLLLAAAEQREQVGRRCSCVFDEFGSPPSPECPFHSERDIQQRQQIATLTAERDEARTLVQTLGDHAERFRRERDHAREECDLLRESTTAALNLVTKLHTPS